MKRIQLFEFEDLAWFPDWLRTSITRLLVIVNKMMGVNEVLASLIHTTSQKINTEKIVDLGSGSGGAMPDVVQLLKEKYDHQQISLTLTDLYPSPENLKQFNSNTNSGITYAEQAVDASQLALAPAGLKTMVNCFHHMPPNKARAILQSAQESKQALLIYELSDNTLPTLIWWLFLPISFVIMFLMVWFMTPFVKPFTFRQFFFTYIIPVIPIFYFWDGQASMPRTYSLNDYNEILPKESSSYTWEKGYALNDKKQKKGTYLLGTPKA